MDMIKAAEATLKLAKEHDMHLCESDRPELDYDHLEEMLRQMSANQYVWSEGKLGRWLGWLQASVVSHVDGASLDVMKEINTACRGD